jgi:phosphatidate cytidylyltransferase
MVTNSLASLVVCAGAVLLVLSAALGPESLNAGVAIALLASLLLGLRGAAATSERNQWSRSLAAILYAGLPLALLVALREATGPGLTLFLPPASTLLTVDRGVLWVLIALTTTWATDVFAYASGRVAGHHLFAPALSPRKTWEGTLGGVVAGTATFAAWGAALGWPGALSIVAGMLTASAAVAGDLVESGLKRQAGVKDAGSLLPGHGGLLDRIDSLAFSAVVVFLMKTLGDVVPSLRLGS